MALLPPPILIPMKVLQGLAHSSNLNIYFFCVDLADLNISHIIKYPPLNFFSKTALSIIRHVKCVFLAYEETKVTQFISSSFLSDTF